MTPAWRPPGRAGHLGRGQARARAAELAEAREAAQATAGEREKAQDRFDQAEADLAQLREDAKRADQAEQEARTRLAELTDRIAELGRLLRGAPDAGQVTAQLARRDELEAAAAEAEQRLLGARAARGDAERALADLERAESAARARLSAARDPLVRLGAPALDGARPADRVDRAAGLGGRRGRRAGPGHRVRAGEGHRGPFGVDELASPAARRPGGRRGGAGPGGRPGERARRGRRGAGAGPRGDQSASRSAAPRRPT